MKLREMMRIAVLSAILFASKEIIASVPNVELVTFLIITCSRVFKKEMVYASLVFSLLECLIYGIGLWTVMYLYIWPLIAFVSCKLRNVLKGSLEWALLALVFGLSFGALCALVYLPFGFKTFFTFWLSGVAWDFWHGISNFIIMVILEKPVYRALKRIKRAG